MSNDLSNLKASESYGRLVQVVDGSFYDGYGNSVNIGSGSTGPTGSFDGTIGTFSLLISTYSIFNGFATFSNGSTVSIANNGLYFRNPSEDFTYRINTSEITSNRVLTIPLLSSDDTFVTQNFTQSLSNKIISSDTNDVDARKIYGFTISSMTPSVDNVLSWNGFSWSPKSILNAGETFSTKLYYDGDNLIKKETYSDSGFTYLLQTKELFYDIDGNLLSYTMSSTDEVITKEFFYDLNGNLTHIETNTI